MEHDINEVIRNKVLHAERHEVRWKKDQLWNRLHPLRIQNRATMVRYMVAAAAAMITAFVIYQYQMTINQNTTQKLLALEKMYDETRSESSVVHTIEESCPESVLEKKELTSQVAERTSQQREEPVQILSDSVGLTTTGIIAVAPKVDSVAHETPVIVHQNVIQPIIGIVDTKKTQNAPAKRKNKLRLMRSSEVVAADMWDDQSSLITKIKRSNYEQH